MAQLALTETSDGIRLPVKACPGARRNELRGIREGRLVMAVTAAAEKGRANAALINLLAKSLDLPRARLQLVSGHTGSLKSVFVTGITPAELAEKLARLSD